MKNKTLISELRKSRGWIQERLAEESGLNVRTIQRLEGGDDASLDTLRVISETLDVPINKLFERVEDTAKEKEISQFSEEQAIQINKRQADEKLARIINSICFVLMLVLAVFISEVPEGTQEIIGTIWVACFIVGFAVLRYIRSTWWANKLDEKYPLTKSLLRTTKTNRENNNKVVRSIMMVFWGAIIPLIFILKYALHLF